MKTKKFLIKVALIIAAIFLAPMYTDAEDTEMKGSDNELSQSELVKENSSGLETESSYLDRIEDNNSETTVSELDEFDEGVAETELIRPDKFQEFDEQYRLEFEAALRAGYTEEQFEGIMNIPKFDDVPVIESRIVMTADQQKVVSMARAQLGKPYQWAAQGPNSFDCGGLVRYVYKNSVGIDLPMGTESQRSYGKSVNMNSLLPGDLLFWLTKGTNVTEHVAIYIGNGQFIHSPQPGEYVSTVNMAYLNPNEWYPSFARRLLPEAPKLPSKNEPMPLSTKGINYETHVTNVGWMNNVADGTLSGSVGYNLPIEAIKITFGNKHIDGSVQYRVHIRNKGWSSWVNSGSIAGTTGQALPLEAFQVRLTGQAAIYYDIEYQAHVTNKGWLPNVKNGQTAGTTGNALNMQAIKIILKRKPIIQGSTSILSTGLCYRSHISNEGWLGYVKNGEVTGTTGLNLQMEKLEVFFNGSNKDIEIDSHIKNIGWVSNSGGTVGENKWIEAIRIRTKGELAKQYNIEYRVHSTNRGWMGWVRNGEQAGTTGQKLQIQAVQIRLIKK